MAVARECMDDQTILPVTISIMQAWFLVTALQLAWRHPGLSPQMKMIIRDAALQFSTAIWELHPAARAILSKGWNTDYD